MSEDNAGVPLTQAFGERVVYDNPWVRLVQVEIEPPDGHRFWHHVVRLQTVSTYRNAEFFIYIGEPEHHRKGALLGLPCHRTALRLPLSPREQHSRHPGA